MDNNKKLVNNENCFILTYYPWRENSYTIEIFSENFGRLSLIARGAKNRNSDLRGMISLFVPLKIYFYGNKNILYVNKIEWIGGWPTLKNQAIITGFYINELIIKFLAKEDPHPNLYSSLIKVMRGLSLSEDYIPLIRKFEWELLTTTGIANNFLHDINEYPIDINSYYLIEPTSLPAKIDDSCLNVVNENKQQIIIRGIILKKIQESNFEGKEYQNEILKLNRFLINYYLEHNLNSKLILSELFQFKQSYKDK